MLMNEKAANSDDAGLQELFSNCMIQETHPILIEYN
jgi:hypothetical protein